MTDMKLWITSSIFDLFPIPGKKIEPGFSGDHIRNDSGLLWQSELINRIQN